MAKKVVATLRTLGKEYSKVIRMKRSEKTGAYYFEDISIDKRGELRNNVYIFTTIHIEWTVKPCYNLNCWRNKASCIAKLSSVLKGGLL